MRADAHPPSCAAVLPQHLGQLPLLYAVINNDRELAALLVAHMPYEEVVGHAAGACLAGRTCWWAVWNAGKLPCDHGKCSAIAGPSGLQQHRAGVPAAGGPAAGVHLSTCLARYESCVRAGYFECSRSGRPRHHDYCVAPVWIGWRLKQCNNDHLLVLPASIKSRVRRP